MFPSILSTFARPSATDRLNSPSHSALHNTVSSALGQVEAVIGVDGISSVVGTMMYDLRSPASGGGGHIQAVNKGGTGLTSYTKGDILVAQSSSVLSKLAVGTDGLALVADSTQATGIKWGSFPTPIVRTYTQSILSTWTKPSNLSFIVVEVQAGGTGGTGTTTANVGAVGGAGGAYARKIIPASSLASANYSVLGGVGGAGGPGSGGAGVVGGTSHFGSIVTAIGQSSANGDVNMFGGAGDNGVGDTAFALGGVGGKSFLGAGGIGGATTGSGAVAGAAGVNYGGGGGGGASGTGGDDAAGGKGGDGIVIITEY